MLMALRKKMRANEGAMMHLACEPLMAIGACSRDEPQPKFCPPTMISPGLHVFGVFRLDLAKDVFGEFERGDGDVKPTGDDFVGVHVFSESPGFSHGNSLVIGKWCVVITNYKLPFILRGSVILPVSAVAAAVAGLAR
jgi:hypothetical protein